VLRGEVEVLGEASDGGAAVDVSEADWQNRDTCGGEADRRAQDSSTMNFTAS